MADGLFDDLIEGLDDKEGPAAVSDVTTPISTSPAPDGGMFDDLTPDPVTEAPEDDGGNSYLGNIARGAGERFFDIAGGMTRFVGTTADTAADWLEERLPLGQITVDEGGVGWRPSTKEDIAKESPLIPFSRDFENTDLGYDEEQATSWEEVKSKPISNVLPFALEQGLLSTTDMIAVMTNLPAYVAARTGEIGQARSENDERSDATFGDFIAAAPASIGSALLERVGAKGMFGLDEVAVESMKQVPKEMLKAGGKEAATEFGQESLEGTAETLGTKKGFDLGETLERGAAGAVGGGPFGAGVRGVTATYQHHTQNDSAPTDLDLPGDIGSETSTSPGPSTSAAAPSLDEINMVMEGRLWNQIDPDQRAAIISDVNTAYPTVGLTDETADEYFGAAGYVPEGFEDIPGTPNIEDPAPPEEEASIPENVAVEPETVIPVSDITPEAAEFLEAAKTSMPGSLTNNLRRIANENGVEITGSMTPADLIAALQSEQVGGSETVAPGPVAGVDANSSPEAQEFDIAAQEAETAPSDAQIEAGNYKKGHSQFEGMDLTVENARGSTRSGTDPDGTPWEVTMPAHYGDFNRTKGADGEKIDFYMGQDLDSQTAYVVDQIDAGTKKFDEHKVMLGFSDIEKATETYDAGFSDGKGPDRRKNITEVTLDELKDWIYSGHQEAEFAKVSRETKSHTAPHGSKSQQQSILKATRSALEDELGKGRIKIADRVLTVKGGTTAENIKVADEIQRQADISTNRSDSAKNRDAPKRKGEDTFLGWISKRGGIEDVGGEFKSRDLDKWHVGKPGMRKLIRKPVDTSQTDIEGGKAPMTGGTDRSYQGTFESAVDNGFFPELDGRDIREFNGIDALLEKVDQELTEKPTVKDAAEDEYESQYESTSEAESIEQAIRDQAAIEQDIARQYVELEKEVAKHLDPEELYVAQGEPITFEDVEKLSRELAEVEAIESERGIVEQEPEGSEGDASESESVIEEPVDGDQQAAGVGETPEIDAELDEMSEEGITAMKAILGKEVSKVSSMGHQIQAMLDQGNVIPTERHMEVYQVGLRLYRSREDAPTTETVDTADGKKEQSVIKGAEQDKAGANQKKADAPLKATQEQKGIDGLGLFDPDSVDTTEDLFAEKPEPKESEAEDGVQDTVPDSDEGSGPSDVQPTPTGTGDGQPRSGEGGGSGDNAGQPSAPKSDDGGQTGSGGTSDGSNDGIPRERRDGAVKGENYRIEPGALSEERGPSQKAKDNIRAIELTRSIEAEGRPATKDEQAELALYVGWGGLKNAFPGADGEYGKGFETVGPQLRELLSETEYSTARRSIQYAHYTSETIISAMWDGVSRLGFKGGQVFEPGMGVGHFAGLMPDAVRNQTSYHGLELDHVTASIARLLYPRHGIRRDDFTKAPLPENNYDLVIGNPPFADVVVSSDPKYSGNKFLLHDYFFAKSLDSVRPGGLLAFVTSAGTMNKIDPAAREYMADRADMVGAVRLPGDAFAKNAGTSVTTDILFFRKKDTDFEGAIPSETWTATTDVTMPNKDGVDTKGRANAFFVENPDRVLGTPGFFDPLYQDRYAVKSDGRDLAGALTEFAASLPENVMSDWQGATEEIDFGTQEIKDGSYYIGKDGALMQQSSGLGREVLRRGKGVKGGKTALEMDRIKAIIPIRDALRAVYDADLKTDTANSDAARTKLNKVYDAYVKKNGPINKAVIRYQRPSVVEQEGARSVAREEARYSGLPFDEGAFDPSRMIQQNKSTSEIARARKEAREAAGDNYDEGTFDPANMPDKVIDKRPNIDPFSDDQENYRLRAIEDYNEVSGEATKKAVFSENIITKEAKPTINSIEDALLYSLNQHGRVDIEFIAQESNMTEREAVDKLGDAIFAVPSGGYETKDQYLSGDVRAKLEEARQAADKNSNFRDNVSALEAAQPAPLPPSEIGANLGMPWLPPSVIEDFGRHLGLESINVNYSPIMATWAVGGDHRSPASTQTWGTSDRTGPEVIQDAMNRVRPRIYQGSGNDRVFDPVATEAVEAKITEVKEEFRNWVFDDAERANKLADIYNRDYNNIVVREYNGDYLTTPGISSEWSWRPHQTGVISRIIQSGNTYMAHAVGAGKTSAMIGAGMEMRRLGLVRKPMYSVPNHMLGQFTKEFYEQYPLAKIAVADERNFHTDRRKQFIANVASEDLDAVIITHSAFGKIPVSSEFEDGLIQKEADRYREALSEIPKGGEDRITRGRIEKQIERLEQRLSGRGGKKKDQVFTFEEMGVDFLFMDEAHQFRKLDFTTKMGTVKGISPAGSQMAWDLNVKAHFLETVNPGRSLVLASGTPITNTMAELYSLSRYIQPAELSKRGLQSFDAWAGAFGDTATNLEQDAAGGYKSVTRFAKFINVQELSSMVRLNMDVVTSRQLDKYVTRPKLKGGQRIMNMVEKSDDLAEYQESLAERMKDIAARTGPPAPGDDIILSVINDGRKAAIDMRFIEGRDNGDEKSKLEDMIDNVHRIWKETKRQPFHKPEQGGYSKDPVDFGPATQMIFSNLGINAGRSGFSGYAYTVSELTRRGVPRDQIAVIGDYKTHVARQRLFNDMNEGKVRIMIGSVPKMGTGVNAQRRLYAVHNMDPLWYPSDDEQRNGRALRQGNMNPEIELHDYSTHGTYDSTMWGMMETKARFIQGFYEGDASLREMDDLGEASMYEQAKAMSTNDPRIMQLTEMRQSLEKLRRKKQAFERSIYDAITRVSSAERTVERSNERIPHIQTDIGVRTDLSGDNFTATVEGVEYDNRAEFGEAAMAISDAMIDAEETGSKTIGKIGGFDFEIEGYLYKKEGKTKIYQTDYVLKLSGDREAEVSPSSSALGTARVFESALGKFEKDLAYYENEKTNAEKTIEQYADTTDRTFDGQPEIDELAREVKDLETTLANENKEEPPARAETEEDGDDKMSLISEGAVIPEDMKTAVLDLAKTIVPTANIDLVDHLFAEGEAVIRSGAATGERREVAGKYSGIRDLITVALESGADPLTTLRHEGLHALRAAGFFTDAEWSTLEAEADAKWKDKHNVTNAEEAIAYAYGDFRAGGKMLPKFRRIFARIRNFLTRLGNLVQGMGYKTAEDIFGDIESGTIGQRDPEGQAAGEVEWLENKLSIIDDHRVRGDAEQEAAIARTQRTAHRTFSQKVGAYISDLKETRALNFRQGMLDQFAAVEALEKGQNGNKLLDAAQSAYKAMRMTQNLHSVMAAVLRHGPLQYTNGGFKIKEGHKGFENIFEKLAKDGKLHLWKGWASANRAQRLKKEDREKLMSDSEIMALLRLGREHPEFQGVMDEWTAFNKQMLDTAEASGLINAEQRGVWEHSDYVPFYRIIEGDTITGSKSGNSGIEGQRSGIKNLTGGESQINDIIENMVMNMSSMTDRSMKNVAAQKTVALGLQTGAIEKAAKEFRSAIVIAKPTMEAVDERIDEIGPDNVAELSMYLQGFDTALADTSLTTKERDQLTKQRKKVEDQLEMWTDRMGFSLKGVPAGMRGEMLKTLQIVPPTGPDIISIMVDGKPEYYRVLDTMLYNSMTSLTPIQIGGVMKLFRMSKRLLTEGVTMDPAFMLANVIRDTMSAYVITGKTSPLGVMSGFAKALREDSSLVSIMAAGGGSGGFYRTDPEDVSKIVSAKIRGLDRKTILDTPKKLWEAWHKVGAASEAANRISVYEKAIKNGDSEAEAAYQALNLLDFSMRGEWQSIRMLIEMVPFLNARMQGLYRLGEGVNENKAGFMLRGGLIMGATLALMAVNWDDPRYEELDEWDKDTYYHFWIDGQHYRLPKGFEVGAIFSTLPERMIRAAMGKDTTREAAVAAARMFLDTFAFNPTPQLLHPILEQYANTKSFTGSSIVPQGLEGMDPEAQHRPWTSETAVELGKLTGASPLRLEHAVKGYLGSMGGYLLALSDAGIRLVDGDRPPEAELRLDEIPVMKRFVRTDPARSTKFKTEFYRIKREASKAYKTLENYKTRGMIKEARDFLSNPDDRQRYNAHKGLYKAGLAMSKMNRALRSIQDDKDMRPKEKRRRADAIIDRQNSLAERVVKAQRRLDKESKK